MKPEDYQVPMLEPQHFLTFVSDLVKHDFGVVHVPSAFERPEVLTALFIGMLILSYVGWKVYTSTWIGNPWIWTTACVSVFMFAASGALQPTLSEAMSACVMFASACVLRSLA